MNTKPTYEELEAELRIIRLLIHNVAVNMPVREPDILDGKRNYAIAYSAWVAGKMLSEHLDKTSPRNRATP